MIRLLKFLFNLILYVAIVVGLIWGLPKGLSRLLNTPYPMASITSGSMWPVFKERDLIFIKGISSKNELKVGDIVVWKNPKAMPDGRQGFTIHRIAKLNENTLVTKGDANFKEDEPVAYENVAGKAFSIGGKYIRIPYIGFITITASRYK